MWNFIHTRFSRFFLVIILMAIVFFTLGNLNIQPVLASVIKLEEKPGQILYQSRQKLFDSYHRTWQAIAFKRILPNGENSFKLRLVGFPGAVEILHPHSLSIKIPNGKIFEAADISDEPFTDSVPAGNVGQYDLKPIIFQLPSQLQLGLSLATQDGSQVNLGVSPLIVQEWQEVATQ
jgi:hypothetical protein